VARLRERDGPEPGGLDLEGSFCCLKVVIPEFWIDHSSVFEETYPTEPGEMGLLSCRLGVVNDYTGRRIAPRAFCIMISEICSHDLLSIKGGNSG
jgi:hypothetical protein